MPEDPSVVRKGDGRVGRVVPERRTIVRHDRLRARWYLRGSENEIVFDRPPGAYAMSILERSASPPLPARSNLHSDRLRVITAGRVGNMEARLGASGFEVVAVAETEDALIDAVSADEPDAIVVEADLCDSLEHVRDLAPDAVLIVVGDHTPAGALGRIERGVSGTAMAGLLHALVAEGVGAAVVWGLVPAFGPRGALHVPERMSVSLLSAKADLVRAYVATALRDHAELVTAASTVAVTVSASLVLTLSAARTHERPHERPERVVVPSPAVERAPQYQAVAVSPTTPRPAYGPFGNEGEPGDRRGPNPGESRDHGRLVGEDADDLGQNENAGDDVGQNENAVDDVGQNENAGDHGKKENAGDGHGQGENAGDDHGQGENAGDDHGQGGNAGDDKGKDGDDQDGDDQGDDQDGDDQGDDQDGDDQGDDESDGGDQATEATQGDGGDMQLLPVLAG
jgi:hypothetical protein